MSLNDWLQRSGNHIPAVVFGAFLLVISIPSFVNRGEPALLPTVVTGCEHETLVGRSHRFNGRMMNVRLANGQSVRLDCFEYRIRLDQCVPIGTPIEKHRGDFRYRLNGSRPAYWWYLITLLVVAGTLLLSWGCAGMWRLRESAAPPPDFVETTQPDQWRFVVLASARLRLLHAILLAGSGLAIWLPSALVGGLQKYELLLACAMVAVVGGSIGGRWLEGPWRRWTSTTIGLDRSNLTVETPWWRRSAIRMPLPAVTQFAPADSNPRAVVALTFEPPAVPLDIQMSTPASAATLAARLNHALDLLKQPRRYR